MPGLQRAYVGKGDKFQKGDFVEHMFGDVVYVVEEVMPNYKGFGRHCCSCRVFGGEATLIFNEENLSISTQLRRE